MSTADHGFKIESFNHTSFTVPDIDRLLSFLVDGLGFPLMDKSERASATMREVTGVSEASAIIAFVKGPGHVIELIEYTAPDDRKRNFVRPCDNGFAHLAFNVDDVDAAVSFAGKHHFNPIHAPSTVDSGPNTGNKCVYLRARLKSQVRRSEGW